jgi:ABC-type transport system substrate-binding protein
MRQSRGRSCRFALVSSVLAAILLVAGCAAQAQPQQTNNPVTTAPRTAAPGTTAAPVPTTTAKTGETPRYGGTLRMIRTMSIINLGYVPDYASPDDVNTAQLNLDSLLALKPDGLPGPWLATDFKLAPDNKSITFKLRQGVKFHDGTDFNAAAVKYNLELFNTGTQTQLKAITSVDIVDDYTVKVNLSKLDVGFMAQFATRPGQMESETALKKYPKEWFLTNTVGTGPYRFVKYTRDISAQFERFDAYWQKGKPYLDAIQWVFIADQTTALMTFKSGQAETIQYPPAKDRADLQKSGFVLTKSGGPIFTLFMADAAKADSPWSNVNVRRAVAHAIDRETMAQQLGMGWYDATQQLAPAGHWSFNKDVKGYPYDPAKAKQLLKDAGFPNGFKTTLYSGTTTGDMFESIQAYLKAVGIETTIEPQTMAQGAEKRQNGWPNGLANAVVGLPAITNPYNSVGMYYSKSGSYPNSFHNAALDDLLVKIQGELDDAKRTELTLQFQKMMVDEYAVSVPLYMNWSVLAKSPKVKDLRMMEFEFPRYTPEEAWLAK